ncbi:alkaline phosphatase family protein [Nocardioides sp. WS12]|uniref:alkaline phosphatase family protein n=1 Tax=Nocardioides sp. WS12 TaxID=2486272 RepID=UPI0015F81201|nr:alkaline phosphatase family protein [Nocardioides sp. WS12]
MTSLRLGARLRTRALTATLVVACSLVLTHAGSTAATPASGRPAASQVTASEPVPTAARLALNSKHVIAISVDGLNPAALTKLGPSKTPNLHKLIVTQGAGTTNARTQIEMTVTLPNHTSMVTGRRIKASAGGHGVTWNTETSTRTVQQAAGHPVSSVFEKVHAAGGRTAVFSTKAKFALFDRSWPTSVGRSYIKVEQNGAVTTALRDDLASVRRSFYFLHLGLPDQRGHTYGWMSPQYLDGVKRIDLLLGSIMIQVRRDPALSKSTVIILTSDHGGVPGTRDHGKATDPRNFRVPFAFWGAGVDNIPLYTLNRTTRRVPSTTYQPGFGASPQPIRNGELANAALDVLGLGPVTGSLWDRNQDLAWHD